MYTQDECDSGEDIMTITMVTQNTERVNQIEETQQREQHLYAGMMVDNNLVKFQIDCGATCNVIPVHLFDPNVKMEHTDKVLVMYNKSKLRPLGKCKVKVRNPRNQKLYRMEFQVVDEKCSTPLLGRKESEAMKLIKVQYENIYATDSMVTVGNNCDNLWTMGRLKAVF